MGNVKFDYEKVSSKTDSIKKSAQENLKNYADVEYGKLKQAIESCKGDYKTAISGELTAERDAVIAAAEVMIKLQEMMKQTALAFQKTDQSYAKGAKMPGKR